MKTITCQVQHITVMVPGGQAAYAAYLPPLHPEASPRLLGAVAVDLYEGYPIVRRAWEEFLKAATAAVLEKETGCRILHAEVVPPENQN